MLVQDPSLLAVVILPIYARIVLIASPTLRCMLACRHLNTPPAHAAPAKLDELMPEFVRDNAGKAFEFMVEKVDEDRKAASLGTVAEMFAGEMPREARDNTGGHVLVFNNKLCAKC